MSPFTGPVFSRPDGLGGLTWHRRHHTLNASENIGQDLARDYFGAPAFVRLLDRSDAPVFF